MVDTQVNTTIAGSQWYPSVAVAADGSFVITWYSDGQDGAGYGIYGQRYAADGTAVGAEFQVNTTTASDQLDPAIAMAADGSFVITWRSLGQDGSSGGIFGQRYAADGTTLGSEFQINTTILNDQSQPSIAAAPDGSFAITWRSLGQDGSSGGIFGQRYAADGTTLGSEFQINTTTLDDQSHPSIAAAPDGSFVVTWISTSQDGSGTGVYGQRFAADGTALGVEFQINTTSPGNQGFPSVAAAADGSFVVVWQSSGQDGSGYGVYGQRFAADGTALGGEFLINTTTASDQYGQSVAVAADGSFVVTWMSDGQDGSGWGVYGQRYSADGTPLGTEFQISAVTDGDQGDPSVVIAADGSFVVTWYSFGQDGSDYGVFMRKFDANGAPLPDLDLNGAAAGSGFASGTVVVSASTLAAVTAADATILGAPSQAMSSLTAQLAGRVDGSAEILHLDAAAADAAALASLAVSFDAGTGTLTISGNATLGVYGTILRGILYGHDDATSGLRTVTITTSGSGGTSTPAVSTLDIDGRPAAVADSLVAQEDTPITFAAADLLGNDIDGTALVIASVSSGAGGTAVLNGDGSVTFTPDANFHGTASFTYTARDTGGNVSDPATVTVTVTDVNDAVAVIGTPGDDSFTAGPGSQEFDAREGIDTIAFGFKLTEATVTYSGNKIVIDGPGGSHTVLTGFETFAFSDGVVNNSDGNWLVDDLFYYAKHHDVWNARVDADTHFATSGWREGRDPNAFFDISVYLSMNPDVRAAGINPLTHFDQSGWKEGRAPSPNFDLAQYLAANPDIAAARIDPLAHFLQFGASEGRQPFAYPELPAPNGFDYVHYLANNADVAAADIDPFQHFQQFGWKEGRNPNALFDMSGYLASYDDVKAAGVNPLDHYHQQGWKEGRDPGVGFDTAEYLAAYADVKAAGIDPLAHYLAFGRGEGRLAFADDVFG